MLYQSMSGDSASGANTFSNYDKSTIQIQSSSSVYFSALILFITHAQTKINEKKPNNLIFSISIITQKDIYARNIIIINIIKYSRR